MTRGCSPRLYALWRAQFHNQGLGELDELDQDAERFHRTIAGD